MLHITPLHTYIEAGYHFYILEVVYNLVMPVASSCIHVLSKFNQSPFLLSCFSSGFIMNLPFLFSVFLYEGMLLFLQLL